jgi:hypothetical protein
MQNGCILASGQGNGLFCVLLRSKVVLHSIGPRGKQKPGVVAVIVLRRLRLVRQGAGKA